MGELREDPALRDRRQPFRDRTEAGKALADSLSSQGLSGATILAIPPGGVPIALEMAERHALPLDLFFTERLVMSDVDEGFGSVAWGGGSVLDRRVLDRRKLAPREMRRLKRQKLEAIRQRARKYGVRIPEVEGKTVILADEGMISGNSMLAAVKSLRRMGAATIIVAVPTAPGRAIMRLINEVDLLYCLSIRKDDDSGLFSAYSEHRRFGEPEAMALWAAANEEKDTRNPYHTVPSSIGIPYDR